MSFTRLRSGSERTGFEIGFFGAHVLYGRVFKHDVWFFSIGFALLLSRYCCCKQDGDNLKEKNYEDIDCFGFMVCEKTTATKSNYSVKVLFMYENLDLGA